MRSVVANADISIQVYGSERGESYEPLEDVAMAYSKLLSVVASAFMAQGTAHLK